MASIPNIIPLDILQQIKNDLATINPGPNQIVELEARFGTFRQVFESGVSRRVFIRLRDQFTSLIPNFIYIHSRDRIYKGSNNERFTTIYDHNGLPTQTFRTIKTRVNNFDIPDYSFRISTSIEQNDQIDAPQGEPIYTREKKRWSFEFLQRRFRIDLTEVTTYRPGDHNPRLAKTVYEVEVEVIDQSDLNQFNSFMFSTLKDIQDTLIIYKADEKRELIGRVNTLLGVPGIRTNSVSLDAIIQPRNLKIRDMVVGGLVPSTDRSIRYTVTIKADGVRRLLVIDRRGMYLVYADEVKKLFDEDKVKRLQTWHGTIFECELIPQSNLTPDADSKYRNALVYVLIYDVLAVGGQQMVRNLDYFQRIKYAQKFVDTVVQNLTRYIFELKEFHQFSTVPQFYQMTRQVLLGTYPFKTDGLIYTPDNYRYDTSVNSMRIRDRKLTRHPDVLKWKPPSQLTIDFAIRHILAEDGNYIELLSSEENRLVPFTGTQLISFAPRTDIVISEDLINAPNETVFEFRWDKNLNADEGSGGKFVVVRPRYDKPFPNRLEVALDVWEDIHFSIDEETITGRKFSLIFRYHNRVKWGLFNTVRDGLPPASTRTLLDIGSGRGGDVRKWFDAGFTHIICVEPNEANRDELKRRLVSVNEERTRTNQTPVQFHIIPTVGQDYERIVEEVRSFAPGGFVDTISYMLSLSFFFDRPESSHSILQIVHQTLKRGGYFIALTIDGRYVLEFFNNPQNYIEINGVKKAQMNLIDFQLVPTTGGFPKVFINIPDSIVTNQTEYLTNIPELQRLLEQPPIGMKLISEIQTNKEMFLSPEEIQYSQLFTAFVMKRS
jgi:hypothetical protein